MADMAYYECHHRYSNCMESLTGIPPTTDTPSIRAQTFKQCTSETSSNPVMWFKSTYRVSLQQTHSQHAGNAVKPSRLHLTK